MNVKELIEELRQMDPTAEVHIGYNYGDYWRTTVAPVAETVDEMSVKHSEYHRMDKLTDDEDEGTDVRHVVVIMAGGR